VIRRLGLAACCALLMASASARAGTEPIPGPATDLYPGTIVYDWTFYVPVVTTERLAIAWTGPRLLVRSRQYDYEWPGLVTERRWLFWVPEFDCKYPDWRLPNECGVAWRKVYGDFPQLAARRDHIHLDVPEWTQGEYVVRINVPRCTWTPRTLTLVLPALYTEPPPQPAWGHAEGVMLAESPTRARAALEAAREASRKTVDEALAALDESVAEIESGGGDPSKLVGAEGTPIDLRALRAALLEQRAAEAVRYDRIRAELDAAVARPPSHAPL
jgi:hypothetical protein